MDHQYFHLSGMCTNIVMVFVGTVDECSLWPVLHHFPSSLQAQFRGDEGVGRQFSLLGDT